VKYPQSSCWLLLQDWGECIAYCGSGFQKRRRSLATLPTACGAMPVLLPRGRFFFFSAAVRCLLCFLRLTLEEGHREDYRLCDPALPACEQAETQALLCSAHVC